MSAAKRKTSKKDASKKEEPKAKQVAEDGYSLEAVEGSVMKMEVPDSDGEDDGLEKKPGAKVVPMEPDVKEESIVTSEAPKDETPEPSEPTPDPKEDPNPSSAKTEVSSTETDSSEPSWMNEDLTLRRCVIEALEGIALQLRISNGIRLSDLQNKTSEEQQRQIDLYANLGKRSKK